TFKTDQDNAIICADPESLKDDEEAKRYFAVFTDFVKDALVKCGFPICPGNYMASNPRWRQPISVWKSYFSSWINVPKPEAILASVILFDFRPIHGDFTLAEELKRHLLSSLKGKDMFLLLMAKMAVNVKPPLSFLKTFVVEKDGIHKNKFNIKFKFLSPLINIVRLFALEARIEETSTLERIKKLMDIHDTVRQFGEELKYAFEFIMMMKIVHQFNQLSSGLQPDNYIDPNDLSNLQKKTLKESCQLISRIQDTIENKYLLGRLAG
ncbi:MAG: DUF294 nucleotidyltransferase-like domain-containing protein, partial [Thermodesulfovibrionales bacterium]|nr:DUF294 nucleotidyltransferase-like domain-containing protein [Thermodesulfovibrionales bacterium]